MDAATLFVIFTLHSSERRMYKLHFPSLEECAQTAKHWRRGGKPYDKTKRMFVFCATRYAIGPLADEPKAYLRITWHLPGGAERRWMHPYPSVTACHAAAADARKLAATQGGYQIHYECKTDFVADKVPPSAG